MIGGGVFEGCFDLGVDFDVVEIWICGFVGFVVGDGEMGGVVVVEGVDVGFGGCGEEGEEGSGVEFDVVYVDLGGDGVGGGVFFEVFGEFGVGGFDVGCEVGVVEGGGGDGLGSVGEGEFVFYIGGEGVVGVGDEFVDVFDVEIVGEDVGNGGFGVGFVLGNGFVEVVVFFDVELVVGFGEGVEGFDVVGEFGFGW